MSKKLNDLLSTIKATDSNDKVTLIKLMTEYITAYNDTNTIDTTVQVVAAEKYNNTVDGVEMAILSDKLSVKMPYKVYQADKNDRFCKANGRFDGTKKAWIFNIDCKDKIVERFDLKKVI